MRIERFTPALAAACLFLALTLALTMSGCHAREKPASAVASSRCLPSHDGYLRARLRGARNLDIDWSDAQLQCEGSTRPGKRGLRVTFAGPTQPDGHRLRFVFGVAQAQENVAAHGLPANLTIIVEGAQQLFSTAGDDKCTVDELQQQPLAPEGRARRYRVSVRGFCTAPADSIDGSAHLLISRFDFAGPVSFEDTDDTASAAASKGT